MKALVFPRNKYKDHSAAFSAFLLINNYERERLMTEDYVKRWILNYILYMKPSINFKDEHTNRNFYNYIIRDKQLSQTTKISLTTAWLKVYEGAEYFFSRDNYDYTAFHYWLVMGHYKVALQILMYWSNFKDFELPYHINMEEQHEFHDHPLTFFLWKNVEDGIKKNSKREKVLKLLLKYTNSDVLLIKNKDGYSIFDFILQKDHLKVISAKKKYRSNMINLICENSLRAKYLFMVLKAKPLQKISNNLKVLIAQNLA